MEGLIRQNAIDYNEAEPNTKENTSNQNDSGCETSTTKSIEETLTTIPKKLQSTDLLILRDPETNTKLINKLAYAKLHRSLSPTRTSQLDSLKQKYERTDTENETRSDNEKSKPHRLPPVELTKAELELIRNKSRLPVPTSRGKLVKSEILAPSQKVSEKFKYRHSLMLDRKSKKKDENSNVVFRKSSSSSGEFISIVPRSESIETVDKLEKELDLFTMDKKPKDKKRTNSFRKIFSGKIFSKEKKKKTEAENILQHKRNIQTDNLENENNVTRHPYRNSPSNSNIPKPTRVQQTDHLRRVPPPNIDIKEIEKRYAEMRVKEFNNIKHNFENQNNLNDTEDIPTLTPGPMDFKNVPNINKFIDTSSSASTMESERELSFTRDQENSFRPMRFPDNHRDTPPRAQELRQDVRLVNPKALIPINSERPLPNPYQNTNRPKISPKPQIYSNQNTNSASPKTRAQQQFSFSDSENKSIKSDHKSSRPYLDETYGTVFDSLDNKKEVNYRNPPPKPIHKPPRSPSLEPSKLKLPPNRDIGPMSPRIRSPIPQHHVSTEKLIATELLRTTRSPTPTKKRPNELSSSHQKLELNIDYPDNVTNQKNESARLLVTSKPPISRIPDQVNVQRNSQISPAYDNTQHHSIMTSQEKLIGNTIINSSVRSLTPNNLLQNSELSPLRPNSSRSSTPVELRGPYSPKTQSPQKEEIRKSVEAYYWKEIKKLKEQENMDLYYYQMQMIPFGYAEDPLNFRRSRSSSPASHRNGRRSLSLPREPKSQIVPVEINENYARFQPTPIPEGRAVVNYPGEVYYQQNFRRNVPERRTIDSVPRTNSNTIYRPIFKRGSLTTPARELMEEQQQKKVSFNGGRENPVWPTRNGYTQSPPQRKIETHRLESLEDDVFMPAHTSKLIVDGKEIYGYTNRPYDNHISSRQDPPHYQNANFYKQIQQEPIYNMRNSQVDGPARIPAGLTRYNSMQLVEPMYGQQQRVSRRMSFDNSQGYITKPQIQNNNAYNVPRRQVYIKDDVYGYFGGYIPNDHQQNVMYSSRQNIAEPIYGYRPESQNQVTVKDKVCDIYGQIHDRDSPSLNIRKSGVMLGQLQPAQQSYSHLPKPNFVRNSRLTSSANDMYRRYQNVDPRYGNNVIYNRYPVQDSEAPSRPLPPVPTDKKVYINQNAGSSQRFVNEQQTISAEKNKKRGIFGDNMGSSTIDEKSNTFSLERLFLLEQLHLLRRQQELENNKRHWLNSPDQALDGHLEKRRHCLETKSTENISIADLKKTVLLEELKLLRLKIKYEIDIK